MPIVLTAANDADLCDMGPAPCASQSPARLYVLQGGSTAGPSHYRPQADAATPRLFDHLVGALLEKPGDVEAERLGGLKVDHQLVLGRRLHRQVGWLLALEDAVDVTSRPAVRVDYVRSIREQAAAASEVRERINRGQSVACCKRDDQMAMSRQRRSPNNDQAAIRCACECSDAALNLPGIAHVDRAQLNPKRRRDLLNDGKLTDPGAHSGISEHRCSCHAWRDLFEQFDPFSAQAVLEQRKSSDVAARLRQALDVSDSNRVDDTDEHNRHGAASLLQCSRDGARRGENDLGRKRDKFCRVSATALGIERAPTNVDPCVAPDRPAPFLKSLMEHCDAGVSFRIVGGRVHEYADASNAFALLRARPEWPRRRRAAEQRNELAPFQLIELHSMPTSQTRIVRYRIAEAASGGTGAISQPAIQSESGPGHERHSRCVCRPSALPPILTVIADILNRQLRATT